MEHFDEAFDGEFNSELPLVAEESMADWGRGVGSTGEGGLMLKTDVRCNSPSRGWSEFVFTSASTSPDSGGLMRAAPLRAICRLGEDLRNADFISTALNGRACIQATSEGGCCPNLSPGALAATLVGKSSCALLTEKDVAAYVAKLQRCAPLYADGTLARDGMVDQMTSRVSHNQTAVSEDRSRRAATALPLSCLYAAHAPSSQLPLCNHSFLYATIAPASQLPLRHHCSCLSAACTPT